VLAVFTALIGDPARTKPLWQIMAPWTIALIVDFIVSFSYTLTPRKPNASGTGKVKKPPWRPTGCT
jgi:hypothetical protein